MSVCVCVKQRERDLKRREADIDPIYEKSTIVIFIK